MKAGVVDRASGKALRVVREQAKAVKQEWADGAPPDTQAALQRHPRLVPHKSLVIDLAYEEFCRRRDAGETIDAVEFCECFPVFRSSLGRRLGVDKWAVANQDQIAALPTVVFPEPGEPFDQYTLLRDLGHGSFARVYLATEESTGDRPVVLKVSFDGPAEARTLGKFTHPNIVQVLSAGRDPMGFSYVCMPYHGNATLLNVLDHAYLQSSTPPSHGHVMLEAVQNAVEPGDPEPALGPPPPYLVTGRWVQAVVHVGERLADALALIHSKHVCHRDLKPSNILLDAAGQPRLLDFNLSEDQRAEHAHGGGTLAYMAPEQLLSFLKVNTKGADARADLFALGIILYELLTGQHPFGPIPRNLPTKEIALQLLQRQQTGCTPVRKHNPQVDHGLASLIESCLAYEPTARPQDATEVATFLRRWLLPSRRRFLTACGAGVGLLLVSSSGGFLASHFIQQQPLDAPAEYARGKKAFAEGQFKEADRHFERALTVKPNEAAYQFARGRSLLALDNIANAQTYFTKASELKKQDGRIWAAMAYCQMVLGDAQLAIPFAKLAEQCGFTSVEMRTNRACSYLNQSRLKEAEADLTVVLAEQPDCVPARFHRAMLAFKRWDKAKGWEKNLPIEPTAKADILAMLQAHPKEAQLHLHAAHIHAALADNPQSPDAGKACKYLAHAVELGWSKRSLENSKLLEQRLGKDKLQETLAELAEPKLTARVMPWSMQLLNPVKTWLDE